jgi:hypothetical protein
MNKIHTLFVIFAFAVQIGLSFGQQRSFGKALSYEFGAYGGAGIYNRDKVNQGSLHFGGDMRITVPGALAGMIFEFGYAGPSNHFSNGSALFSVDYLAPYVFKKSHQIFGAGGYTRLFGSKNAISIGSGYEYLFKKDRALRFEVRDYCSALKEHNVAFRVGYVLYAPAQ